ncbi:MAG: MFS transporter [Pseudomonadota bacterium]|nr:MFS transporter [Pseudomonadota bacterium]
MAIANKSSIALLATIIFSRMLGLFMFLPVFAIAGQDLAESNWTRIGLAIGIYGLFQALLQLPFGILSDRYGRRPLVLFGLLLFAAGGIIAGLSDSIWGVILGRALQGAGAVSSAILAWAADLTPVEDRSKAMAVLGMVIGLAFGLSLFIGPVLYDAVGLSGLFYFTSGLAALGMLVSLWVPEQQQKNPQAIQIRAVFSAVVGNKWPFNFSVFLLHFLMTGLFLVLPSLLANVGLTLLSQHAWMYLPTMALGFFIMLPMMIYAEKKQRILAIIQLNIALLAVSLLILQLHLHGLWVAALGLLVYFTAFNLLEALMPSWVSRLAEQENTKGASLGAYAASQFLGAFAGSSVGGMMLDYNGLQPWLWTLLAVVIAWYFVIRLIFITQQGRRQA